MSSIVSARVYPSSISLVISSGVLAVLQSYCMSPSRVMARK